MKLKSGFEKSIKNGKLEDMVLSIGDKCAMEKFGVVVRIEGHKHCPKHEYLENNYASTER